MPYVTPKIITIDIAKAITGEPRAKTVCQVQTHINSKISNIVIDMKPVMIIKVLHKLSEL